MVGEAHKRTVRCRLSLAAVAVVGMAVFATGVAVTPRPGDLGTHPLTLLSARSDDQPRSQFPGFVLDRGKAIPIEADDPEVQVFPAGINNHGVIVGEYVRPDVVESGLRRDPNKTITTFNVPGAAGTEATDINDSGVVSGSYSNDTSIVNNSARPRGFVLNGKKLTTIEVEDAVGTAINGINDRGQAVGAYMDSTGVLHGLRWKRGRITTIDFPGAANTTLSSVNNRGQIVGTATDATGTMIRGFLWEDGLVTDISVPGAAVTSPQGINNRGQIVGYTADDPALTGARGFLLAKGVDGPLTTVEVPGAPRTVPAAINDCGQIVGLYESPNA